MTSGVFGDDIASTVLNSVTCSGNETELLVCFYSTSATCSEHNAAVICQGKHIRIRFFRVTKAYLLKLKLL